MAKLPWRKWYPSDWICEQEIAKASLKARGLWAEALNCMMYSDTHTLVGTPDEMSRLLRCSVSDFDAALEDLIRTNVGQVECRNGVVRFTSRRLRRESGKRDYDRNRQSDYRKNKNCDTSPPVTINKSSAIVHEDSDLQKCRKNVAISVSASDSFTAESFGKSKNLFFGNVPEDLTQLPERLRGGRYANEWQDYVQSEVEKLGYVVRREVPCFTKDFGNGRIDLVAEKGGFEIAIELDNRTPRWKSVSKIKTYPAGMVLLRQPKAIHNNQVTIEKVKESGFEAVSKLRSRLSSAYGRTEHHRWTYHEEHALADVVKGHEWEKELAEILSYRERLTPDEARFFPKSIIALLEKWGSILDRARAHQPAIIPQAAKSIATKQIEGMMRTMGGEI